MIINDIDLGGSHPWAAPIVGQTTGIAVIEGIETITWPRGSIVRKQTVDFYLQAWYSIGGATAMSLQAAQYLVKQVEEMVSNKFYQPCYIQWTNTAQTNQPLASSELHDGWYVIEDFEPNYQDYILSGIVKCTMTVSQIAPQVPRRMAMSYMGGALSSNIGSASTNVVTLPLASTAGEASFTRTGAEGALVSVLSPAASPEPFVPSSTIGNFFDGGVRVYDTINTSSNPVPTSGTFVNANWVEVRFTDHDFKGDCVLTNGLILMLFQVGQTQLATCYLWNTSASTAAWQQFSTLGSSASGTATLNSYTLAVVSPDECALTCVAGPAAGGSLLSARLRLQRGRYEARVDVTPLSGAYATNQGLTLIAPSAPKISYNGGQASDCTLDTGAVAASGNPHGAAFIASTTYPFVFGFIYQNQPGAYQPLNVTNGLALGDNASLANNAMRSYGIFATPYGVSGSYSTANLQAEGEGGTLAAGWATTTDASASASSAARCASGTTSNRDDVFGTAFSPTTGTYDVWYRVKVTSTAGTQAEMTFGLWDPTAAAWVSGSSATLSANQATTAYSWIRPNLNPFSLPAAHATRFRAVTALVLGTNWFVDEAALVPRTLSTANNGPQDIGWQWMYDRTTRVVRV